MGKINSDSPQAISENRAPHFSEKHNAEILLLLDFWEAVTCTGAHLAKSSTKAHQLSQVTAQVHTTQEASQQIPTHTSLTNSRFIIDTSLLEEISSRYLNLTGLDINNNAIPSLQHSKSTINLEAVIDNCRNHNILPKIIENRQKLIFEIREKMRYIIEKEHKKNPEKRKIYEAIEKCQSIERCNEGSGGVYFIKDSTEAVLYTLKPSDETLGTLNNPKKSTTTIAFKTLSERKDVFPYLSSQHNVLAYDIAMLSGFKNIVPQTILTIKHSNSFHVVADQKETKDDPIYYEKLCSAQAHISGGKDLMSIHQLYGNEFQFHKQDYDEVMILCWITGESDAHGGNFLVYNDNHLAKIESGLAFGYLPKTASGNHLTKFLMSNQSLSAKSIQKIQKIPTKKIVERMLTFEKSPVSIEALKGRISILQDLVKNARKTPIFEIDEYMSLHFNGKK